jgi:protein-S-isoprenylcysteine O-methyltransferase Ste14
LFALQHSGMARPEFKKWLTRIVPVCLERSLFVLISSITVIVLMLFWQPIGAVVWSVESASLRFLMTGAYFSGWVLIVWSTFLIDHFSYFGLRQAYTAYRGGTCDIPGFQTPGAYRVVRHPIQTGWLIVLWAAPTMTVTRLILAMGLTLYILVGTQLAESRLEHRFGSYTQYMRKVPMLLPSLRRHLLALRDD